MNENSIRKGVPTTNEESNRLRAISSKTSLIISIMATILALVFGWLQFSNLPFKTLFDDRTSNILFKIIIAVYYFAWIFGTSIDLEDEEYAIIVSPNKGKLTTSALTIIIMLGILFGCLCWANTTMKFTIILDIFFVTNIVGWYYICNFVEKSIQQSKLSCRQSNNTIGLYQIEIIQNYLSGDWQKWRFLCGFCVLILLNILTFTNLSHLIQGLLQISSSQFIIVIAIYLFICVMEVWIWIVRFKRKMKLNILSEFNEKFILTPIENNEGTEGDTNNNIE